MTVLVVLKPNFGGTIERVIQRIAGTMVGGVIAMLLSILTLAYFTECRGPPEGLPGRDCAGRSK